ncbi:uncharacterized protein LOC34622835 [Cyclospora cayetanensis]|uniref:Uncharacterized protein LOC34622835 n=1 Tax=Cyclospora cayetanensis TaxID=88456 RepID=A0A6P6RY79_9EIME|nr:uncharacterized protein LOC34622835 [Cyclospora cayetanensis]
MALAQHSDSPTSIVVHSSSEECPATTSSAYPGTVDPSRGEVGDWDFPSICALPLRESQAIPRRTSRDNPAARTETHSPDGAEPLHSPWFHLFANASFDLQKACCFGSYAAGPGNGIPPESPLAQNSSVPVVQDPPSSIVEDGANYQQQASIAYCIPVETRYTPGIPIGASSAGAQGPNAVVTTVPSNSLFEAFPSALQLLTAGYSPLTCPDKRQEGALLPSAREPAFEVGKRCDGESTWPSGHFFISQSIGCAGFGRRMSPAATVARTGVPVTKHFDPLRPSPFDMSKFDRRDPYFHFYIPVDCPFGTRCCDGACPLAHTKLEKIFHPTVYKKQRCQMVQMTQSGRCQYTHKCAFFHAEEDRQEAEHHWKLWESTWASWRQHIDQLLLCHHKLEKEIRRKVEGIAKIRMPRSAIGDAVGRSTGNAGALIGCNNQQESTNIHKSSRALRPNMKGSRTGSIVSPSLRKMKTGGFAEDGTVGTRASSKCALDAVDHPSEPAMETGVAAHGTLTDCQSPAIQLVNAPVHDGPNWMHKVVVDSGRDFHQYRLSSTTLASSKSSKRCFLSAVSKQVLPTGNTTLRSFCALVSSPELVTQNGVDICPIADQWRPRNAFWSKAAHEGDNHHSDYTVSNCTSEPSEGHGPALLIEEKVPARALTTVLLRSGEKDLGTAPLSGSHQSANSSALHAIVATKTPDGVT